MLTSDVAPLMVQTIQTPQRKEHYMSKCVLGLSVTQIIIGKLCIMLQLVLIVLKSPIYFVGQGIWTGVFFALTGTIGIVSSQKKTTWFIVPFLTLSIISSVLTTGILTASSFDMIFNYYPYEFTDYSESRHSVTGINAVLIILAVIQAVVAIISAAFSCHGLCPGNQTVVMAGQVHYVQGPDGQQQMVILPFNQQGAGLSAGASFNPVQTQLPAYNQPPPPTCESDMKLPIPE